MVDAHLLTDGQVEFLGDEAQAHFKTKAQSIERAYQMLSGAQP